MRAWASYKFTRALPCNRFRDRKLITHQIVFSPWLTQRVKQTKSSSNVCTSRAFNPVLLPDNLNAASYAFTDANYFNNEEILQVAYEKIDLDLS